MTTRFPSALLQTFTVFLFFFFFQAEDGIRDLTVTGVQTCALPIFYGGARARSAHAVDVREPDPHVLVHRDVDTSYACHVCLTSTLTLLVPRVRADDVHDAAAAHDLAVLADLLDRRTHFHDWPPEPLRP